jgi:hypothetical protein
MNMPVTNSQGLALAAAPAGQIVTLNPEHL